LFETLKTGIDGLDALLAGGVRYPSGTAAFMFVTGGPGTGKTLLGLEMLTRAWTTCEDGGATFLYYTVEQSPADIQKKLQYDFGDYFGASRPVSLMRVETPYRLGLEIPAPRGGTNRLVLTQVNPAALTNEARGANIDIDWIHAEIENYRRADRVGMVCIDNVSLLLNDLDYFAKRSALLDTRRTILQNRVHGIFVQEEAHPKDLRFPSAEEFSTDLLIRLSFSEPGGAFKARTIEIQKARHQYYYRGPHHFSIAGRDLNRDLYLGARSERGPGVHIYPSVPAQLSIVRDRHRYVVPARGTKQIDLGIPELTDAFSNGTGPAEGSSTVILAEAGTRYTVLALRFLAAGLAAGEHSIFVSTKEDQDAIQRICHRNDVLKRRCLRSDGGFDESFRILYLHPEFISPGKFTWDILRMVEAGRDPVKEPRARRLAFDNIFRLSDRFPLLEGQTFLIPALIDLLRYELVTPLFVDLVPPGSADPASGFNPATYLTNFDNVFHLFPRDDPDGTPRPYLKILKSIGNDFRRDPFPIQI
jgi:KaiC/GvpD/RAD55 family RecA-like ATPase